MKKQCVFDIFITMNVLLICLHTCMFVLVCMYNHNKTRVTDVIFTEESVPYFCVAELQFSL
jgi:hypothetical protein